MTWTEVNRCQHQKMAPKMATDLESEGVEGKIRRISPHPLLVFMPNDDSMTSS